uniref:Uncharacterized protein n=1 Tax=Myoviridae sp. ctijX18 TaxID=2825154 RepID=A0A8S5UST7_9CAUD|nr:MAG TPA: hypothetical protein [Myoviridae sp. ctijX18]DAQ61273.1 MAG TPA: hypothetical protein [Caudoviricetes sp.]
MQRHLPNIATGVRLYHDLQMNTDPLRLAN